MKIYIKDRRKNLDLRKQFDKAYNDLRVILSYHKKENHYKVIIGYLKTYDLLTNSGSARGRLLDKLAKEGFYYV